PEDLGEVDGGVVILRRHEEANREHSAPEGSAEDHGARPDGDREPEPEHPEQAEGDVPPARPRGASAHAPILMLRRSDRRLGPASLTPELVVVYRTSTD